MVSMVRSLLKFNVTFKEFQIFFSKFLNNCLCDPYNKVKKVKDTKLDFTVPIGDADLHSMALQP